MGVRWNPIVSANRIDGEDREPDHRRPETLVVHFLSGLSSVSSAAVVSIDSLLVDPLSTAGVAAVADLALDRRLGDADLHVLSISSQNLSSSLP